MLIKLIKYLNIIIITIFKPHLNWTSIYFFTQAIQPSYTLLVQFFLKMIHNNTRYTYYQILEAGLLSKMQTLVYNKLIENNNITAKKLAAYIGLPINSVTGRIKELKDMGLVIEKETIIQTNNKPAAILHAKIKNIIYKKKKKLKVICSYCNGKGFHYQNQMKLNKFL